MKFLKKVYTEVYIYLNINQKENNKYTTSG